MAIGLIHRYVILKRQSTFNRSSLYQESSCSYFFFFSVGWLCLAKLDESSKFGCFLPALLLLPFPICNAPPLILTIPNKNIQMLMRNKLIMRTDNIYTIIKKYGYKIYELIMIYLRNTDLLSPK